MEIEKIEVKGLYGLHDYSIHFDPQERIKIIHAPNGYGKTTVLKLIKDIIEGNLIEISLIPFESFKIQFDQDLSVEVIKGQQKNTKDGRMCYKVSEAGCEKQYCIQSPVQSLEESIQHMPVEYIEKNLFLLKKLSQMTLTGGSEEGGGGLKYYLDEELDKQLKAIRSQMPVYFINANRLFITDEKSLRRKGMVPSVMVYARELRDSIKSVLAQAALKGQALDRTFPARLIHEMHKTLEKPIQPLEIQEELESLEKKRKMLQAMDLLTESSLPDLEDMGRLDENTLKVLKLYIKDSQEKLSVFDEIAPKIELMQTMINKRFAYKTMCVSKKDGFLFKVPTDEYLTADKLSSGEQNELVLIYELLFKSHQNAFILMDEPEISLHIAWQQNFLEDMEAIAELTGIKIVIATHSPDIINGRWELTTDLEED